MPDFDDSLKAYLNYRDEDKHECTLVSARVNTLLIFNSFCATAAAIVSQRGFYWVVLLIALSVFLMNGLTSIGIGIGRKVLREWHLHGARLIEEGGQTLQ